MLETLLLEIYPPDYLVNLAIKTVGHRAKGRSIPDLKWSYVMGTDANMGRCLIMCSCVGSRGSSDMHTSDHSIIELNSRPLIMRRHFHISQRVYFLGICHYCDTVYWASPEIKKIGDTKT